MASKHNGSVDAQMGPAASPALITRLDPKSPTQVEYLNPRNGRWEVVTDFLSIEGAKKAVAFYNNKTFRGW